MKLLLIGLSLAFLGQNDGVEIRGAWRVKSGSLDGEPIKILDRTKHVFVFCDDNKLLIRRTGEPDRFAKVTLGPGLRTKDIDLVFFGDDDQTIGSTGIYKLKVTHSNLQHRNASTAKKAGQRRISSLSSWNGGKAN